MKQNNSAGREKAPTAIAPLIAWLFIPIAAIGGTGCAPAGLYDIQWSNDVEYARRLDNAVLRMDIATPKDRGGPAPAVIWVHGGGWELGRKEHMRPLAAFTASLGYVSATVQYRLMNGSLRFPEPVRDVAAAVRYLRKNAATLGIDADRIVIGGESAGGHLALLVGLNGHQPAEKTEPLADVSCTVSGIIDIYGPADMAALHDRGGIYARSCIRKLMGGTPAQEPDAYAAASPVQQVRPDAPPILILHGEWDGIVPFEQSELLVAACHGKGTPCELSRVRGAGHGWVALHWGPVCRSTYPVMANFLGRVFK